MRRRQFLRGVAAVLGALLARRSATAQQPTSQTPSTTEQSATESWPLASPLVVQRAELSRPWQAVPFDAWFELPPAATGGAPRERLLKGYVLRLPNRDGHHRLAAFCRLCTHEHCWVDLRERMPALRDAEAPDVQHPVLVCPCHTSVFDPAQEGQVIAGPAPRALYRFELDIGDRDITITGVERAALNDRTDS